MKVYLYVSEVQAEPHSSLCNLRLMIQVLQHRNKNSCSYSLKWYFDSSGSYCHQFSVL